MNNWCRYFSGKKITVMGLGLLGRGVGDIKFLAECGAKLIVTDLKSRKELKSSLLKLKRFKDVKYRLGEHKLKDFRNRDLIIKAAGVPLNSPYISHAKKNRIPVVMSTALFARLSGAKIIGVTGTRGKSTTAHLIFHLLKTAGIKSFLGGNVRGISTLSLLKEIQPDDIAVLELDSWQLQGFGDAKISTHIAVFTNFMPDHLNYYKGNMKRYLEDKKNIFRHQSKNDFLVIGKKIASRAKTTGTIIIPRPIPKSWRVKIAGEINRENAAFAAAVAKILKIKEKTIKKGLATFKGLPGRLELIRIFHGVKIYNDTTATTPHATKAGIESISQHRKIILIMGGAEKNLNMKPLLNIIPRFVKKVILIPGTGTNKLPARFRENSTLVRNLKEAINCALMHSRRGDSILFSPAFASFGMFKNEFDRGSQFNQLISKLN